MEYRADPRIEQLQGSATAKSWGMDRMPLPATLWVRPTSGNTLTVEYSTDGGANYQPLLALTGATSYAETQVTSGFTNIKITCSGVQGGTWGVA
jgi:hypothetical protein